MWMEINYVHFFLTCVILRKMIKPVDTLHLKIPLTIIVLIFGCTFQYLFWRYTSAHIYSIHIHLPIMNRLQDINLWPCEILNTNAQLIFSKLLLVQKILMMNYRICLSICITCIKGLWTISPIIFFFFFFSRYGLIDWLLTMLWWPVCIGGGSCDPWREPSTWAGKFEVQVN